jgi:hypothetical protein
MMPMFLVPTKRNTNYGIGLCDRCHQKFFLDDLRPDNNSPGLMVCRADRDDMDPYRLPMRQTENISLPFVRPDTNLGVPGGNTPVLASPGNDGTLDSGGYPAP